MGYWVLGYQVLRYQILGYRVLGYQVLGYQVLGYQVRSGYHCSYWGAFSHRLFPHVRSSVLTVAQSTKPAPSTCPVQLLHLLAQCHLSSVQCHHSSVQCHQSPFTCTVSPFVCTALPPSCSTPPLTFICCVGSLVEHQPIHMYCFLYYRLCRQSVLEGALLERQQIIDQLALQTSWLGHAQSLVHQLRPLGRDLASVEKQYDLMKGFWVEYEEQMEKMDHVLAAGAQLVSYRAETDEEKKIVELVSAQHLRLSEMWSSLREEAEHSKEVLDKVYPELVHLHSLCTQVRAHVTHWGLQHLQCI